MKLLTLLLLLLGFTSCFSDTIQKWTDDSGQIHYGDRPPTGTSRDPQQLVIENSFDPVAYERALIRHSALEAQVKEIEAREKAEQLRAEKRLDNYFKDLDRKSKDLEQEKAKKRNARGTERYHSSIKLKPSKKSPGSVPAQPSFRGKHTK